MHGSTIDVDLVEVNLRPLYETFLVSRGIQEFIRMFGRYPFVELEADELNSPKFSATLKKEIDKTIIHWGQGRRNAATLACIYARTEETILGQKIEPADRSSDEAVLFPIIYNPNFRELLSILPNT